jgi:outer membrane protein OmpA-like peptidoglycan-associated protein
MLKQILWITTALLLFSPITDAWGRRVPNLDNTIFNPVTDGGKFITVHDTQMMQRFKFNMGMITDYQFEPIELERTTGATTSRLPALDDVLTTHFIGGLALADWLTVGFDLPVHWYEVFYDFNVISPPGPKQTLWGLGDLRLETKFRILEPERFRFGLAVVPYIHFPTGKQGSHLSNEQYTYGAKLVGEVPIGQNFALGLNVGYQFYDEITYFALDPSAIHGDTINMGLAASYKFNPRWSIVAETYVETLRRNFFGDVRQAPVEAVGAVRWSPTEIPDALQGLSFTVGAGAGLTDAPSTSAFLAFAGVNYRRPNIVELEPPPPIEDTEVVLEERIIITQKIHFEFDKAKIREISYPILDDVVQLMRENPQITQVEVSGHTDAIGSDVYNQKLSERRSQSVVTYLSNSGISTSRLVPLGYGESRPIATNETTEGRAKNRRTEFLVLD